MPWTYVIDDFNSKEIIGKFYKKELQNPNQKEFKINKVIKRKVIVNLLNEKAMIVILTVRLIKEIYLYKMSYFPERFTRSKIKIIVEIEFNYANQSGLKNATGVDSSEFDKKTDLPNLMSDFNELDIHKFKKLPSGLSSLKRKVDKLDVDKLLPTLVD